MCGAAVLSPGVLRGRGWDWLRPAPPGRAEGAPGHTWPRPQSETPDSAQCWAPAHPRILFVRRKGLRVRLSEDAGVCALQVLEGSALLH